MKKTFLGLISIVQHLFKILMPVHKKWLKILKNFFNVSVLEFFYTMSPYNFLKKLDIRCTLVEMVPKLVLKNIENLLALLYSDCS